MPCSQRDYDLYRDLHQHRTIALKDALFSKGLRLQIVQNVVNGFALKDALFSKGLRHEPDEERVFDLGFSERCPVLKGITTPSTKVHKPLELISERCPVLKGITTVGSRNCLQALSSERCPVLKGITTIQAEELQSQLRL